MKQEKSCGLVLFRTTPQESQFLLLHYPNGHWDLPKGHVESNETEEQTARRELEEETGITEAEIFPGFREEIHYSFTQDNELISKTVVFFCAHTNSEEITISHEHQNFKWLPYEKALEKLTFDNAKGLLLKAHQFLENRQ